MTTRAERGAARALRSELAPFTRHAMRAAYLAGASLQATPEAAKRAPTWRAQASLLARIPKDLRACVLLARHGYADQLAAVAASLYEAAYDIGYIGRDSERADRWATYTDMEHRHWSVWDAVAGTLKLLDLNEQLGDRYRMYTHLCLPKHSNPVSQRLHGLLLKPDGLRLQIDVYASPGIRARCKVFLWYAIHPAIEGTWVYNHIHLDDNLTLLGRTLSLAEGMLKLKPERLPARHPPLATDAKTPDL